MKRMAPWFSFCTPGYFTAYDPPTALKSARAFGSGPTATNDARSKSWAPQPSITPDPGARKTTAGAGSTSLPTKIPTVDQSTANVIPVLNSKVNDPNLGTSDLRQSGDLKQIGNKDQGSHPNQDIDPQKGRGFSEDPGPKANANTPDLPSDAFSKDQLKIISNQVIHAVSDDSSLAGPTLAPGAPPFIPTGKQTSFAPSFPTIDTSPINSASVVAKPITTTVANQVITAAPNAITLPGTTIGPGDPSTSIDGTQIALDPEGQIIINSNTIPPPLPSPSASNPFTTSIGGRILTAVPAAVELAGTTLSPGAPGLTIGGTVMAANSAGQLLICSGKIPFPTSASRSFVTTVGDEAVTAIPAAITIDAQTISAGDAGVSVNGTLLSLDTAGRFLVGEETRTFERQGVGLVAAVVGSRTASAIAAVVVTGSVSVGQGSSGRTNWTVTENTNSNNVSSPGVYIYTGEAGRWRDGLVGLNLVVVVVVMGIGVGTFV